MNRIVATLVVALAFVLAGCGQNEAPSGSTLPSGAEKFDKKVVPNKASKGSTAN
jgi:hypothetical protein